MVSAKPETFSAFCTWSSSSCLSTGLVRKRERAALGGLHRIGNGAVGGKDDDPQTRRAALDLLEQADAVHLVHAQVGDDQVRAHAGERGEGRSSAFDGVDFVIFSAQTDREQPQQPRIVVND